jgi:hypothetical protein
MASARSNNDSRITLTGSGTFDLEKPGNVTGGGTFEIHDSTGALRVRGNYNVTRLVRFQVAPGITPTGNVDGIARPETVRAGLAVFEIHYSDDTAGTLVVSCHLMGTSDAVFEGITATKDFVGFWNRERVPSEALACISHFGVSGSRGGLCPSRKKGKRRRRWEED